MTSQNLGFWLTEKMIKDLEWVNNKFVWLERSARAAGSQKHLSILKPIQDEWWKFYRDVYNSTFVIRLPVSLKIRDWNLKADELRQQWETDGLNVENVPGGGPDPFSFLHNLVTTLKWVGVATVAYLGIKIYADLRNTFAKKPQTAGLGYTCARRSGKLTTKIRRQLPSSEYGLPKKRKYPMPDVSHAINAKGRASAAYRQGHLSKKEYDQVVKKADRIIKACRGRT